jgi:hypothetical protein
MDRLTSHRAFTSRRTRLLLVPVLAVVIAGCSAAAVAGTPNPPTNPTGSAGLEAAGAPAVDVGGPIAQPQPAGVTSGGASGSGSANMAIAYPYPGLGGSAGLAPDHELVVSGTGWATVKVDLSDRATAQRSALAAALADARAQAQAAASDAGVTLGGVVSMSVSVGGGYAVPMGVIEAPDTAPGTAPSSGGGGTTAVPPVAGGTAPAAPTTEQLEVTVTVAYAIS